MNIITRVPYYCIKLKHYSVYLQCTVILQCQIGWCVSLDVHYCIYSSLLGNVIVDLSKYRLSVDNYRPSTLSNQCMLGFLFNLRFGVMFSGLAHFQKPLNNEEKA